MKLAELAACIASEDQDEDECRPSVTWLLVQLVGIVFVLVVLVVYLFESLGG